MVMVVLMVEMAGRQQVLMVLTERTEYQVLMS
jgi:hypothetical protein